MEVTEAAVEVTAMDDLSDHDGSDGRDRGSDHDGSRDGSRDEAVMEATVMEATVEANECIS